MFSVQIVGIDIKGPCILQKICLHSYYATFTFTNEKILPLGLKPTPSYEVHHSDKHIEFYLENYPLFKCGMKPWQTLAY
jgi:hypothetical protein